MSLTLATLAPSVVADSTLQISWAAKAAKLASGPSAPGSKQIPVPKDPDCLSGLALVFTGELSAFSREEAVDLAKRFGASVFSFPLVGYTLTRVL